MAESYSTEWAAKLSDAVTFMFSTGTVNPTRGVAWVGIEYDFSPMLWSMRLSLFVILLWTPIFYTIRMRLYPVRSRRQSDRYQELVVQFIYSCVDACVMAYATDIWNSGNYFNVFRGVLIVAFYIWMYTEIPNVRPYRAPGTRV
ncbi:hypothetical protein F4781DRAFT_388832 [Annulohypoxylon bovei var. microspora]|nr:hypothetical protein F4781DRAFT_388832 [Annulohypoxylon bovei var. microspora]